jgi:hypothetical protein
MRELKFRVYSSETKNIIILDPQIKHFEAGDLVGSDTWHVMQFTGLHDKNGTGITEVCEGDIISASGEIIGNEYEIHARETDFVVPSIRGKAWPSAYKKLLGFGFDYAK